MGMTQFNSTQNPLPVSSSLVNFDDNDDDEIYHYNEEKDMKFKNFIQKMIWDFGFACFFPTISKKKDEMRKKMVHNCEHNKAWLLAESGGCAVGGLANNAEPHSVHSSFRFSLCSQVELESMSVNSSSSTVLMVNLDNGLIEPRSQSFKWRRIEVLGRGALSYVFKGRVGMLRTSVAIKKLDKEDKEAPKAFCIWLLNISNMGKYPIKPMFIYVFGVVLLELITGRKPMKHEEAQEKRTWFYMAKPLLQQGSIEKLLDPRIKFTERNLDQIARMIQAADACITNEESKRPKIDSIISILTGVEENSTVRTKPSMTLSSSNYVVMVTLKIRQTKE
ncbi:probable serine/threonine-protein kinase PBL7 [Tanacetum coccineum]